MRNRETQRRPWNRDGSRARVEDLLCVAVEVDGERKQLVAAAAAGERNGDEEIQDRRDAAEMREQKAAAAGTGQRRLDDPAHERGGAAGVDGGATGVQHGLTGLGRERMPGC